MKKTLLALLIINFTSYSYAGERDAWDAWNKGDNVEAFKEWKPLAEQGNAKAQDRRG